MADVLFSAPFEYTHTVLIGYVVVVKFQRFRGTARIFLPYQVSNIKSVSAVGDSALVGAKSTD